MPSVRHRLRRLRHEPAVHVLLLGLLVFALHRVVAPPDGGRDIVVGDALRRSLRAEFARRGGVPPSAAEEATLVERWLDDEVQYREALRLGLDRGDVIVRRRLVQKMSFLTEDLEPVREPTDAELAAHLAAHAAQWTEPPRVTFEHVFASRDRHGDGAAAAATGWRDALRAGADAAPLGDAFLRGRRFVLQPEASLASIFGPAFVRAVMQAPAGTWSDPIASSFGAHVVRVTERRGARVPGLGEVRDAVRRDWMARERERLDRQAIARLRGTYVVRDEAGEAGTAQAAEAP